MAVTRDDVARRAGVSTAIVSYVINNGPRKVAPDTRARVLAAIDELGYNPSLIARNLRRQRTATIGVLVPTLDIILTDVVRGAQHVAQQTNYRVVHYDNNHSMQAEREAAEALLSERVEGVIWIPCSADLSSGRILAQASIPLVIIDPPQQTDEFATVDVDNERGGYLATRHLIELGHRRIALIDRAEPAIFSRERVRGYRAALREFGLDCDPALIVKSGPGVENGRVAALELLDQPAPPSAIFAYADMLALGALRAAYERGVAVPGQLSVVGFDGIMLAGFTCPSLTTVAAPKFERGARGAEMLFDMIERRAGARAVRLPVQLCARESSGPAPRPADHQNPT